MKPFLTFLFLISIVDSRAEDVKITEVGGAKEFVVSDGFAELEEVAVKPHTKYTLSLEASYSGNAESIEENPRLEILQQPGNSPSLLPSHEVRFFNAEGKAVGSPLPYAQGFRNSRIYRHIFYSPAEATHARIKLLSGKGSQLTVSYLTLTETADEGALNPNPAFQLGLANYSGWKNIANGGGLIEWEGKIVLDSKYGSTGQLIPLTEPGTYAFSAKATPNGYNSTVIVRVYDADGKELLRSGTRQYGPLTYFVPPKEAVSASFLVYSCLLEEVRLIRVGDENAITALRPTP